MKKILIADDNKQITTILSSYAKKEGLEPLVALDGAAALELFQQQEAEIAMVLLDVMMPKLDGFAVARRVRANRCTTPILMLTAKSDTEDRIEGLNAGADYYLTKPFDTRELLACINALLRRQGNQVNELTMGNTTLDLSSCNLVCGSNHIRLSAKEFDVMRFLMQAKGSILPKEVILARVWGYESNAVDNYVEVYVGFLRKKLASIGSNIRIEAVRRLGYTMEVAES